MTSKKLAKILFLLGFSLFLILLSCFICFFIGEKYFFDKLFYRKSTIFGYYDKDWEIPQKNENFLIQHRTQDIRDLISQAENEQNSGQKDEKKFTIALIGDSFGYGMGVEDGQQFPVVLQEKLNKIKPTRVLNLSLSGDSILDNYAKYELAKKQYKVDLFIIATVDNDLLFDSHDKYPGESSLFNDIQKECPGQEFQYVMPDNVPFAQLVKDGYAPSLSPSYANICYGQVISKRMSGPNVFYILMTHTPDYTAPDPDTAPSLMEKFKDFLSKDSYVIEPWNLKGFEYTQVSPKEGHPSADTHKEYAQILFNEITKNSQWKFNEKMK